MPETTERLRQLWGNYECNESAMVALRFGCASIEVAPETTRAWEALEAVLRHHGYEIRPDEIESYCCRNIKGKNEKSLHSFGVALDMNWSTNPWTDHARARKVRFSNKATQKERANDVRLGLADTDFTEAMIDDALAIETLDGKRVLEWGGRWKIVKDCMHFELAVGPEDIMRGIDTASVKGWDAWLFAEMNAKEAAVATLLSRSRLASLPPLEPVPSIEPIEPVDPLECLPRLEGLPRLPKLPPLPPLARFVAAAPERASHFRVIARDGLRLRAGPDITFSERRTIPLGTIVSVLSREGSWALVDLRDDGAADGFLHSSFLRPVEEEVPDEFVSGRDISGLVTAEMVKSIFPAATSLDKIRQNLPFVISGLRCQGLVDKSMMLMAFATIRAETESFVPISEGVSKYNTSREPFDLYDAGTRKGRVLGNTEPGDGRRFKGRGYVQLTGRDNYTRIGRQIRQPLAEQPDLANEPAIAGGILARFLANAEPAIRKALSMSDLRRARKLVNGGSHGLDRFEDTFGRGLDALPD